MNYTDKINHIIESGSREDKQTLLLAVRLVRTWYKPDYQLWKKSIYRMDYVKGYKNALTNPNIEEWEQTYWVAFMFDDGGKRYMEYLIKEKETPSIEGNSAMQSLKALLASSWGETLREVAKDIERRKDNSWLINGEQGRPTSAIQFRTIDEQTFISQIEIIINHHRLNAKGTDIRAMFESLIELKEIDNQPSRFYEWICKSIPKHEWGKEQKLVSNSSRSNLIPFYKNIFIDIQNTK